MSPSRMAALALLSLTVPPTIETPREPPLPRGEVRPDGPLADTWTRKTAQVHGSRVRLQGLGARTHANWVLFRLPFDATQRNRLRAVRFHATSASPTDVGALRIGSVCTTVPSEATVERWTLYTMSGIAKTDLYRWHPAPPTDDPTVIGLNVPTRVANYVACGWDTGRLSDPENWTLQIDWEER